MRDIIDNPMNEYARIAKYLKNPAIKIDKLAQYAQGANPKVPEFLALAEIKSRQSMVAPSGAAGPVQTVQEDLVGSVTPQPQPMAPQQMAGLQTMQRPQGVAALPSGMNAQSLAGGGIVAFDDGGYVNEEMQYGGGGIVAFDDGGYVDPMGIAAIPGASDASSEDRDLFNRFKNYINSIGGGQLDRYGNPIRKDGTVVKPGEAAVAGLPGQIQAIRSGKGSGVPMTSEQVKNMMPAEQIKGDEESLFKAERLAKEISPKGQALPTVGERGRMAATTGADRNADGSPKEPKEDMYAKYEKMFTEQAAQGKEDRKQDKYMRLLEAGLGIMGGTSQHALTNIGQGAMGAAKGYAQDKAGYRKEDRDNIKELMALGMKKEDAARETEKLAIMRKEAEDKGGYYGAYGEFLRSKGAAAGAASGTGMDKAKMAAVTSRYNAWYRLNPMATPEEQQAKMSEIERQVGMSGAGGAEGPVTIGWGNLGAPKKS